MFRWMLWQMWLRVQLAVVLAALVAAFLIGWAL